MTEAEPLLAFLQHGGSTRQCCLGCSEILHQLGYLRVAERRPMSVGNAPDGTFCMLFYEVEPTHTLEECRRTVALRHVGPPDEWGA